MPYAIVVLGGGPAGLSTALHLAQLAPELSHRVLVLEKAHYPRPKLCAGALTVDAEVILSRLGLDVSQVPHVDAAEAHLDFAGKGLKIALPHTHTFRISIRRDEFDAWLAVKTREAGVEIREGVTAHRVEPRADSVVVDTDAGLFEAAIVVGADGSNGITRRCILPSSRVHTARVLEVITSAGHALARERSDRSHLGGKASPSDEATVRGRRHNDGIAYFDFFAVPQGIAGYTWDFPTQIKGAPMHCWGIYDTNLLAHHPRPSLKAPLAEEMRRCGIELEDTQLQGYPVRWFSPRSRLSVPRVILVGDAAGADGIFGEGISMALGYGRIAASAICAAIAKQDFSFRDYRRRILTSPLGQALTIRTGITHVLYRLHWAWFQRFFWRVFKPVVATVSLVFVLNWAKRMH